MEAKTPIDGAIYPQRNGKPQGPPALEIDPPAAIYGTAMQASMVSMTSLARPG